MSKDSHDIANPISGLFPELAPRVVPVLVPMPAERPYSYMVPEGMNVQPGSIVRVPLGPREVAGIVCEGETDAVDARKLREVSEVFDCPPVGATCCASCAGLRTTRFRRQAWWRVWSCVCLPHSIPSHRCRAFDIPAVSRSV